VDGCALLKAINHYLFDNAAAVLQQFLLFEIENESENCMWGEGGRRQGNCLGNGLVQWRGGGGF
jgi:hypothetical protein